MFRGASRLIDAIRNPANASGDLVSPWQDLNRRIQKYDQAAPVPAFVSGTLALGDKLSENALVWGSRLLGAHVGDKFYRLPTNNPFGQKAKKFLHHLAPTPRSYQEILFNSKDFGYYDIGQNEYFKTYRQYYLTAEGRQAWLNTAKENLSPFKPRLFMKNIFSMSYLRDTVLGNNIDSILSVLREGKISSALLRSFALLTVPFNILLQTRNAYRYEKSREDGTLLSKVKTLGLTLKTSLEQTVKSVTTWELGTLGMRFGRILMATMGWPATIVGLALGIAMGGIGYSALSVIIPDPPKIKEITPRVNSANRSNPDFNHFNSLI
jgi:hypothetical protein